MNSSKTYRNPKYLAWIRTLPCMVCGSIPSTAAHIGTSNFGIKPPDNMVVPLCSEHHYLQEYHKGDFIKTAHIDTELKTFESITGRKLPDEGDCNFYFDTFREKYKTD